MSFYYKQAFLSSNTSHQCDNIGAVIIIWMIVGQIIRLLEQFFVPYCIALWFLHYYSTAILPSHKYTDMNIC